MLKKILLGVVSLLGVLAGLMAYSGISIGYLTHGAPVATGIGSKLLCSARYVSGYSAQRAFDDLIQYSPILEQLTIDYDEVNQTITTSLFGLSERRASSLPNLGCGLEFEGYGQRHQIQTRSLPRSTAPWPRGDDVGEPEPAMQELLDSLLAEDNRSGLNTRAMLVAHRGRVLAESYGQGATAASPLLGWSMAKSMMSVVLGNLEYRNLLDVSQAPPFPEWSNDERAAIRIDQLLTMTDGLDFSELYEPGFDATTMLATVPSASAYALARPLRYAPGSLFYYSSGTANLLGRVHQQLLGSPQGAYDDVVDQVFRPLGMQHAVFETDASGTFVSSSYLYASARDWARLGQLMLDGGAINGRRLLSEDWVRRATAPNGSGNERAYGYMWWLNRGDEELRFSALPADAFYASGNRAQVLMVIPSRELVIVRLGWSAGGYPINRNFRRIMDAL